MTTAPDLARLSDLIPAPLRVRAAVAADLDRLVEFFNEFARPAQRNAIETQRRFEASNPQPNRLWLLVEDEAGRIVATGQATDQGVFAAKDGTFIVSVRVRAEHQRVGIGSALLERLEAHARERGAPRAKANVRGDEPEGVRFAERRGYRERNRRYNSYVDVAAFDESRFEDPDTIAARAGVRLVTWAEVATERAGGLDSLERESYEFGNAMAADIPRPEPIPMPPYEAIRDMFFGANSLIDGEATILALHDGRIVAETITEQRTPGIAYTDFTGTAREWRGKGLALALKLRALRALKAQGAKLFGTTNDEQNAAMRGVNAKLGYIADPPVIDLEKML
ncbi:MAG: GNAT family N-acetyltransferase [Candidatus Limnocylindria bacterium]